MLCQAKPQFTSQLSSFLRWFNSFAFQMICCDLGISTCPAETSQERGGSIIIDVRVIIEANPSVYCFIVSFVFCLVF